jgi:antitoxin component YwqK of YwqJK toxin-antitoxin module
MKSTFTLILTIAVFTNGITQNLRTTYYDFAKTKIDEQYYVNENGEKNGLYKSFAKDNGVLTEQATFVNGTIHGEHKLYDWTSGKAILRQLETYKNGVKHGPAKYFDGPKYSVLIAQGNFVDGKKSGLWTYITHIEAKMPPGFEYYKSTTVHTDDNEGTEGNIAYYYPSGKVFYETKGNSTKSFYPDGKVSSLMVTNAQGETVTEITYDKEGKVISQKGGQ